jgi:hypothetical protein
MATVSLLINYSSNTDAASYSTTSFVAGAGELLVVSVAATDTDAIGELVSTAIDFTLVKIARRSSNQHKQWVFVANQRSSASQTITFNCADDPATGCIIQVFRVGGLPAANVGSAAVQQSAKVENRTTGTPSISFSAVPLSTNPRLFVVADGVYPANITKPTGWTSIAGVGTTAPAASASPAYVNSGSVSSSVTWGSSTSQFCAIAVEFNNTAPAPISGTVSVTESGGDSAGVSGIVLISGVCSAVESGGDYADASISFAVFADAPGERIMFVFGDLDCVVYPDDSIIDVILDDCRVMRVPYENRLMVVKE